MEAVGPGPHPTRVLACARLAGSAFEVELERPAGFRFEPGQSIRLYAGDDGRDFSLTSSPSSAVLTLLVRRVEGGAVSPVVVGSAPGTPLRFSGPHGVFTFMPSDRPAVLVGTGVGIAPFLSMARAGVFAGTPAGAGRLTILHGARSASELFYRRELEAAPARYVACLSGEESPGAFRGRVTEWACAELPQAGPWDFYLCGSRAMVKDMIALVDEKFPGSRVYTEIFF